MWCTSYPHHLRGGVNRSERSSRDALRPTRGNLNMPWELGSSIREGGGGPRFVVYVQMWMEQSLRGVQPSPISAGGMALRKYLNREGNHSGHLSRRLGGNEGVGASEVVETDSRENGQEEANPREQWFIQENSRVEILTLDCMEDDLNSALFFEHGKGQRANQLWIMQILLGRLSWE